MTRLTPCTLLLTLSIALPKLGFSLEPSPLFEKTSLTRSFASQTYLYVFDFDFVNHLSQPIEIISVSVFDMNGNKVEQDWEASGPNWDPRLMTHALSGDHPLVTIISKPRGTPLEQATVSPVGDRIKITVTNRILSAGEVIRPSLYLLSSKNKYGSLILRVAYRINGNLQVASRPFTVRGETEPAISTPTFGIQQLSSSHISNAYKITTNVSCDASISSKVIYTFNDDTKADFVAVLESADPDESSELLVLGDTYHFTPVTVKYPQVVNQAEFTVRPGDKLLACIRHPNGNEQAVVWLRVLNSSFAQLPQRADLFVSAYKCFGSVAGYGIPMAASQAILDFYNGDMSAFQILLKDLPARWRSCIEGAAKL